MVNTSLSAAERSPTNSQNSAVAVRGPPESHLFSTPLSSVNDRAVFLARPPASAPPPAASSSSSAGVLLERPAASEHIRKLTVRTASSASAGCARRTAASTAAAIRFQSSLSVARFPRRGSRPIRIPADAWSAVAITRMTSGSSAGSTASGNRLGTVDPCRYWPVYRRSAASSGPSTAPRSARRRSARYSWARFASAVSVAVRIAAQTSPLSSRPMSAPCATSRPLSHGMRRKSASTSAGEERRIGSSSATAAPSSSRPRVPAASHSGRTALHSSRCLPRSSRITARWASSTGNVKVRGSWLASAPAPSVSFSPPPSRTTFGIQPLRRVRTMSFMGSVFPTGGGLAPGGGSAAAPRDR